MKACFRFMAVMIVLVLVLAGCQSDSAPIHPLDNLDIPETGYEDYFSPVISAQLYVDGVAQPIEPDDPRVLRVLNFLGYAAETRQYIHTQGVLTEEEVNECYASGATMLEVTFAEDPEDLSDFHYSPKILVCGDSFLLFMKSGVTAERHRPFSQYLSEEARQYPSWGGDSWIDILEYCGF